MLVIIVTIAGLKTIIPSRMLLKVQDGSLEVKLSRTEKIRLIMSPTVINPSAGNSGSLVDPAWVSVFLLGCLLRLDGGGGAVLDVSVAPCGSLVGSF